MSATSNPAVAQSESFGKKLRNTAVGTLFVMVLLIPRVLHLRRNPHSWRLFCIFLGIAGAALVVLPLGFGLGNNNFVYAIVGMVMFIAAILLPPAEPVFNVDDKARELGALVVVNGGLYAPRNSAAAPVHLFVSAENISVLDSLFQPVLLIPVADIRSACAEVSGGYWLVRVVWLETTAEFSYSGVFAEHLARVAESTLQSVMRPALPVISQARAARA